VEVWLNPLDLQAQCSALQILKQMRNLACGLHHHKGLHLEQAKTTAPATVNPTQAFTLDSVTTTVFSTSSGFGLKGGSAGGKPSPGITVEATPAATTTSGLSVIVDIFN